MITHAEPQRLGIDTVPEEQIPGHAPGRPDDDIVIAVNGVSKKFCKSLKRSMLYGSYDLMRSMAGRKVRSDFLRKEEFWALRDISFNVRRGEKLGFLGVNGAGKSTLLRMLNGIFPPDAGEIVIKGDVGSLIGLGVGFHPHMTGRENVYLNGTLLGMTHEEIRRKFEEIVTFAEIGDFIDAPVSTYSSGMYVRLGFAIAIHADVKIMLVDEVLSVGDFAFRLKCMRKLSEYRQQGGTFILVSHNMQMIRNTCERVIWLEAGAIKAVGDVYEICDQYEAHQLQKAYHSQQASAGPNVVNLDPAVSLGPIAFLDQHDTPATVFNTGDALKIRIRYHTQRLVQDPIFAISFIDQEGKIIFECYTEKPDLQAASLAGTGDVDCMIERLNIRPNLYYCSVMLSEKEQLNKLEWHEKTYQLIVTNEQHYQINQGIMYPYPQWQITQNS